MNQNFAGSPHDTTSWTNTGHSVREQFNYSCASPEMNSHQQEMSFLRHLMLYDDSDESQEIEVKLRQAECNERCARRAVWLMALLTAVALAGFAYSAIMSEGFPLNRSQVIIRVFSVLGLASIVSLIAFVAYWLVSRAAINEERDECRRLITRIVESRLGKPAGKNSLLNPTGESM